MSLHRFHTACDRCRQPSEEYSAWPSCRDCGDDICPDCRAPRSLVTGDGDGRDTCRCQSCAEQDEWTEAECEFQGDEHAIDEAMGK